MSADNPAGYAANAHLFLGWLSRRISAGSGWIVSECHGSAETIVFLVLMQARTETASCFPGPAFALPF
jgi:hypothetical protein